MVFHIDRLHFFLDFNTKKSYIQVLINGGVAQLVRAVES